MAKLFKETTFAKFKAEDTHELNKIYFIKDKGMMFANGKLYSHNTTDTVTTGGIVEVLAPTVNLTTKSQVTITGFSVPDYVDIDRFTLINTNDMNNIIKLGDAIYKFSSLTEIELQKGDAIIFIKKGTIWCVEIGLGSKMYIPSLIPKNGSTGAISIDSTGVCTTVKYNNMKAWSDTTVPLNAETLNKAFPNVSIGFQVVCYNANRIYEKANVLGDWIATEIKQVPLGGGSI